MYKMYLYVPEILEKIKGITHKEYKKREILKNHKDNNTLKWILWGAFHPDAEWCFNDLPEGYECDDTEYGYTISNLERELKRFSVFMKNDPLGSSLTKKKREDILLSILNCLHPEECKVIRNMFRKKIKIGIDLKMLQEIWPVEFQIKDKGGISEKNSYVNDKE